MQFHDAAHLHTQAAQALEPASLIALQLLKPTGKVGWQDWRALHCGDFGA